MWSIKRRDTLNCFGFQYDQLNELIYYTTLHKIPSPWYRIIDSTLNKNGGGNRNIILAAKHHCFLAGCYAPIIKKQKINLEEGYWE